MNGTVNFTDADGDVNWLRVTPLTTGQVIDSSVSGSLTSGVINAVAVVERSVAGSFQFTGQPFDAKGNASNVLTGALTVTPGVVSGPEERRRIESRVSEGTNHSFAARLCLSIHRWRRLNGKELVTLSLQGPAGCLAVLGAVTLEEFGLAPDPVRKTLIPVAGPLA